VCVWLFVNVRMCVFCLFIVMFFFFLYMCAHVLSCTYMFALAFPVSDVLLYVTLSLSLSLSL
jgi:hypothetical protein